LAPLIVTIMPTGPAGGVTKVMIGANGPGGTNGTNGDGANADRLTNVLALTGLHGGHRGRTTHVLVLEMQLFCVPVDFPQDDILVRF